MNYLQTLLQEVGLEPERLRMFNLSSAMAGGFVEAVNEMVATVKELGPNPLRIPPKERAS